MRGSWLWPLLAAATGCNCARAPVVEPAPGAAVVAPAPAESVAARTARLRAEAQEAFAATRDRQGLEAALAAWKRVAPLGPEDHLVLAEAHWLQGAHFAATPADAAAAFAEGARQAEEAMALGAPAFATARATGASFDAAIESLDGAATQGLRWFVRNQLGWAVATGRGTVVAQRPTLEVAIARLERAGELGLDAEAALLRGELLAALPLAAGGDREASVASIEKALALVADASMQLRAALAWKGDEARRLALLEACAAAASEAPASALASTRAKSLLR
ncbi:hypothetical protein [Vulgatibacter sp.]|uniref:hypothetical protein n=1 Tax=Vulgatibacter sp. TaxID=1971226 RepID=UPI0035690673